jgi:uncharacterized radical SAM superfamily Fe-S cluster-containing enzyme
VVADAEGEVWMRKRCNRSKACQDQGLQEAKLSNNAEWYESMRAIEPPEAPPANLRREIQFGCPYDCGPCKSHQQRIRLPVVTITSACNRNCPICYVFNKNENAYHMSAEEFKKTLHHLTRSHGKELDLINLTGGDPTLHPHLLEFLDLCHEAGIHRVSLCTNGIKLAQNEELVRAIAKVKGRVALSLDSFEEKADFEMQGAHLVDLKLKCLDLLEKYKVNTTIIPVITKGLNDHELGRMIELTLARSNIRHIEFHTITYTGQGGKTFDPDRNGRISLYEVLERIAQDCGDFLTIADFIPSASAHSLCYQVAYLLLDPQGGPPVSFLRFMERSQLYECLQNNLYLEPSHLLEKYIRQAIDRLWTEGMEESDRILVLLKDLLERQFPSSRAISREEALRISEQSIKAIYVHSHMDEETWDNERIVKCCDSNCYPDGSTIPVCASNVLYREKEAHFNSQPRGWTGLERGQVFPEVGLNKKE